jgi:hypothetical protein
MSRHYISPAVESRGEVEREENRGDIEDDPIDETYGDELRRYPDSEDIQSKEVCVGE